MPETIQFTDEKDLIRLAQSGDRQAFAVLVEQNWDPLFRWIYRMTRNSHSAEDLVQESFLKAFSAIGSFRAGSHFRAWLFRIAHNNLINQSRSKWHSRVSLPEEVLATVAEPINESISQESLLQLRQAIERLPSDFRAALLLRVDEELSFREIAEILQITEETARWRVFKARQKLTSFFDSQSENSETPSE